MVRISLFLLLTLTGCFSSSHQVFKDENWTVTHRQDHNYQFNVYDERDFVEISPNCYKPEILYYVTEVMTNNYGTESEDGMWHTKGYATPQEAMQAYVDHEGFLTKNFLNAQ
jgi:hypothetical protein